MRAASPAPRGPRDAPTPAAPCGGGPAAHDSPRGAGPAVLTRPRLVRRRPPAPAASGGATPGVRGAAARPAPGRVRSRGCTARPAPTDARRGEDEEGEPAPGGTRVGPGPPPSSLPAAAGPQGGGGAPRVPTLRPSLAQPLPAPSAPPRPLLGSAGARRNSGKVSTSLLGPSGSSGGAGPAGGSRAPWASAFLLVAEEVRQHAPSACRSDWTCEQSVCPGGGLFPGLRLGRSWRRKSAACSGWRCPGDAGTGRQGGPGPAAAAVAAAAAGGPVRSAIVREAADVAGSARAGPCRVDT